MSRTIELTQGFIATVDDEDADVILRYRWKVLKVRGKLYACRSINTKNNSQTILMHRIIANAPDGIWVDHKDGNGLNNVRANLRLCTKTQNAANSIRRKRASEKPSKFRGVYWNQERRKWHAQIGNGPDKYLGRFKDEEAAARAYDRAAKALFGEFAVLNFPEEAKL